MSTQNMPQVETKNIQIKAPNMQIASFKIKGTAPLVQLRFSKKGELMEKMAEGAASKTKRTRKARDYDDEFKQALHVSDDGWYGFPAAAVRAAMVSACRTIGFKMTLAKLGIFAIADGIDSQEGTPLIKIIGEPELCTHHVRNSTGVADIRSRAMFKAWSATIKIQFDGDMFLYEDIANLLSRVGFQVGIGEGRPDSRASCGMGWGTFVIE